MKKYIVLLTLGILPASIDAQSHISPIKAALYNSATKNHIPYRILMGLCYVESHLKIDAVNKKDGGSASHGLCQIKIKTARYMGFSGDLSHLYDPHINAFYAGKYLRYQYDRYGRDWPRAIAAYNRGSTGPIIENKKYVKRVLHYAGGI